jgi:hypothetical protein
VEGQRVGCASCLLYCPTKAFGFVPPINYWFFHHTDIIMIIRHLILSCVIYYISYIFKPFFR